MARFIVCRASAGSGKTYTLVRQFIEAAISSAEELRYRFGHILAITFTNKAANGMKDRIMSKLHAIVIDSASESRLIGQMVSHLGIDEKEVVRRCAVLESSILHNYSQLSVCTIDSFVHRLVKTFAHDLHLPMNFSVLIQNDDLLKYLVDELMSLVGKEGEEKLTQVLCSFAESRMESGQNYNVEKQIKDLSEQIFREETPEYLAELSKMDLSDFMEVHRRLVGETKAYETALVAASRRFTEACAAKGLTVDDFPSKGTGVYAFFARIADGNLSKINDSHKRVDAAYDDNRLWGKSTPEALRAPLDAVLPEYRAAYETFNDGLSKYNTRKLLLSDLYSLALLNRISKIKDNYYDENEIVHISEFNKRIADEVVGEPTPFIYERIGSHYYNYLIDEFQDTSKLQWQNFVPLLDEAMTYDFRPGTAEPGTQSLVVGDGKQAIYRFRQGDVRQFVQLPKVDSPDGRGKLLQHKDFYRIDSLQSNYRTLANIVQFNNRFFKSIIDGPFAANPELQRLYIGDGTSEKPDLWQQPVKDGGYVGVTFSDSEALYADILEAVRHQVDDLHYDYGDIMILARKNATLTEIADYFNTHSPEAPIPMVSSESFVLSNSQAVLLVLSLLEYLYDRRNRVAAVEALSLIIENGCLKPDSAGDANALLWQLRANGYDLSQLLSPYGIELNTGYLISLSLYDCCEELLRRFNLQGRDTATLLNVVCEFEQRNGSDLGALITYLDDNLPRLSSSTASNLNAVQLMTIHKAKGLEAKIVICVMPDKRLPNSRIWVKVKDKDSLGLPVAFVNLQRTQSDFTDAFDEEYLLEEMDRINNLYVALTRPEQKLLLFCENRKKWNDSNDDITLIHTFATTDSEFRQSSDNTYSIGTDFEKPQAVRSEADTDASASEIEINRIAYPAWQDRISIAAQNQALLSTLQTDSRRYGIIVHDLLAHIGTVDEVDSVVAAYCADNHIADADARSIAQRIKAMMQKEENRPFFDPQYSVKCEAPIAVYGEVRRPDRIVFAPDRTWVVDFKTGTYADDSHRKYQRQVAEYAAALTAMGYPNVQPVIIYL